MKATREESRARAAEYEAKEARRAAISAARDEVVRAAVAWYAARPRPDDAAFMDTLDALHAAVAALARLEKP